MRFLIFGAGAIGGYVGGSLALAGHSVTFVERPEVMQALAAEGLTLQVGAARPPQPVPGLTWVASLDEAFAAPAFDCLVLAVKSFDTPAVLAALQAATGSPPPILSLQNGVDNEVEIVRAFGAGSVVAGTVTTPVSKPGRGRVLVEKQRGLGIALDHPLAHRLVEVLAAAGLHTRTYPAAGPMKWTKLLTNLVGNATSAILDLPVHTIYGHERLFHVEQAMVRECLGVMRSLGYAVVDLPRVPAPLLALAYRLPAAVGRPLLGRFVGSGRGEKMPSLHVDLHGGRGRTEVSYLNGAVARHGTAVGQPAPVNQVLCEVLEDLTAGRRDPDAFRSKPEALLALLPEI